MIRDHKFYEMQSALAAAGQLSETELMELEQHANDCLSCGECIVEMAEMSRELFLMQARRVNRNKTPVGMQERFLERAVHSGIFVTHPSPTIFDPRLTRLALLTVLAAAFLSLSWKIFSFPRAQRAAVEEATISGILTSPALERTTAIVGGQMVRDASARRVQFVRRSTVHRATASIPSGHGTDKERQPYLSTAFFAKRELSAKFSDRRTFGAEALAESSFATGAHIPKLPSFKETYIAGLFERESDNGSDKPAFHYDLKVASLSFLESSLVTDSELHVASVKFNAPVFHLDPNWTW